MRECETDRPEKESDVDDGEDPYEPEKIGVISKGGSIRSLLPWR